MKRFVFWGGVGVFLLATSLPLFAGSLWKDSSSSFFTTFRSFKVGDIITINIIENSSAVSKAGTDTKSSDSLGMQFNNNIGALTRLGLGSGQKNVGGQFSNKYEGDGKTVRTNVVTAKVSARVAELLPNGNLVIEGFHRVLVNDETQTVAIKGVVRSKDVSQQNTVFSWQVADAEVRVMGAGIVAEAEQPGWITRILNWIF